MQNEFTLKLTPKAEDDLDDIFNYISTELKAENAAENLMEKIEHGIMRLKEFPLSGSRVLEEPLNLKGYRKLVIDNYIVFHIVDEVGKMVIVMRVLYGASNYNNIF
jgi:addiction module RelE/StbE family toxin